MPKREELLTKLDELIEMVKAGRNPSAVPAAPVAPAAAVPARTFPKKVVQLDSRDVRSLLRDLEAVSTTLDDGDAEAAQVQLDEVIAGIETSADNGDED